MADYDKKKTRDKIQDEIEGDAYEYGYNNGFEAVTYNIHDLPEYAEKHDIEIDDIDELEELLYDVAYEAEDNLHQFSPFEEYANKYNKSPYPDETWDAYQEGVSDGITDAVDENSDTLEEIMDQKMGYDIEVEKKHGKYIKLTPTGETEDREEIYYAEGLFWNDLRIDTFGSEWLYLADTSQGKVYGLTDYSYNLINDLMKGKTVKAPYMGELEEYEEE